MSSPRGAIVCPARPVDLGNGIVVMGRKPGIIAYVKSGSGRLMRDFERFCLHHGIDVLPVQEIGEGRPHAFECVGDVESLERLIGHPSVAHWHYILNVRVPHVASGSGDEKQRPPMGSAYGKPAQVKATADALHHARSVRYASEVRAGNL